MDNQHKTITGYRDLNQHEIDAMNRAKELANQVGALVNSIKASEDFAADQRWAAIAQTQLQQGFMALIRSVAQPTSF